MSKSKQVIAVLFSVTLILTGCSKSHKKAASATTVSTLPLDPGLPSPLTGVLQRDPNIRMRPVIMLKIDNSIDARPQGGIDAADVIMEERVEGGLTRLIAMFQTNDSTSVGPVRSVRSTDAAVVDPIHGLFGYSGGIKAFVDLVHTTSAVDVGVNALQSAYTRRTDLHRSYEHSLYADLTKIRASDLAKKGATPPALFAFDDVGEQFSAAGMRPATGATIHMGQSTGDFSWDATKQLWMRSTDGAPHMVEKSGGNVQMGVNNVIVQYVPYKGTGQKDPAHNPVDQAVVVGSGTGFALVNGQYVDIKWSKADSGAVTTYTDNTGAPLRLHQGLTWLMFAPAGAAVETR